ncbi:hypothetical protein Acr_13g0004560 [Actinidia rufa]|uniref:Uncharacterized protein n=1 Tax=Actinidia rufa TaxID=165716 RepID=A0A7J0FK30_9ERIC|nr:hypothetical protein Acr_13g0004560 [Actinidia rufa]
MPYNPKTILHFFLIFTIMLSITGHALALRDIPKKPQNTDKLTPQTIFIEPDGSFLIPGLGRYILPRPGTAFNPFTYNPVTGTSGGVIVVPAYPVTP